jgi:hypothetical protein
MPPVAEAGVARRVAAGAAAVVLIHLLLVLPDHPRALTPQALLLFPLELPALVILLVLAPRPSRIAATALLAAMAAVKLADLAANAAYLRPFNPVLDLHLLPALWEMLRGALGPGATAATLAAALAAVAAIAIAAWWATGRIARLRPPAAVRRALAALLLPALALAGIDAAREIRPLDPPGTAFTARLGFEHVRDGWRARDNLRRFRAAAARDGFASPPPGGHLAGLRGRDVIFVFVESYGRSALENPRYAPTITATLAATEAGLAGRGLAMRSGWLTAPMIGGQSWLAHASVLSGLWISDQGRYRALVASPRRTLLHFARFAGWRTVGVMPAVTRAWPEADYFGYDRVLAAADLGYRGKPFNWVTMPDQFTLAAFERAELAPAPRRPVLAEIALISSHAPWTPVPPLLPWEAIGDGRAFDASATSGDPPEVVWRDDERIRDQYRQALDYALRTVGAFAERHAASPPLIVVLGDHQPAAFVSEDPVGRDVPIHLIGPPEVLAAVDDWNWHAGLVPTAAVPAWRMDRFRDRFLAAFARPAAPRTTAALPAPSGGTALAR